MSVFASNGDNSDAEALEFAPKLTLTNVDSGENIELETTINTEIVNSNFRSAGVTQYKTDLSAGVPAEVFSNGGQKNADSWDGSYSFQMFSTIYYSTITVNNMEYYRLDAVHAHVNRDDPGVQILDNHFSYGMTGVNPSGYPVDLNNWYYFASGSYGGVNTNYTESVSLDAVGAIGSSLYVLARRGNSNVWTAQLDNSLQ
ncbi:hypothetical protein [Eubacterium sp.]|uniref:hypothetical protein n=1 Tax=Eubacterium sp. TaxID=142586 RepID=UPI002FCA7E7F